ncbi:AEC family transporter [Stigmatella aurantiaca]|uniref:Auxin efflux carrier family protein n=1 Tax=Stigmatella aurantiaca (strain DW4/3-1) TaxID=378806 RepID=Q09E01_STIAD|nr:AEC family transporter [Stigmatella aurantiaca]ADO75161.1 Auxin efflux carrier family protein [Stigmatella aurantiaca DW4/3-1]EAU69874.1 transporter, auxin efflux carrier (AEC) family [Stigmatella aurantiaca DW4/3-1]
MVTVLSLLAVCLVLGALARRSGRFPPQTAAVFNTFVLHVPLPALVLGVVHRLAFRPELLVAAVTPWLVFLGAWGLCQVLGPRLGLGRTSIAALVLTAGLSNTAFVGLPMAEALLGREGLAVAVVVDQLGSFLLLATLATFVAVRASSGETPPSPATLLRKVVGFPPFLALVLALVLRPWAFPGWAEALLERLSAPLTPLTLFSVGFQLQFRGIRSRLRGLALGLGYKLALAPALVMAGLWMMPGMAPVVREAVLLQNAMAPMVSGAILASEHDLDVELAVLMVGLGIPLSFATAPLWLWLAR